MARDSIDSGAAARRCRRSPPDDGGVSGPAKKATPARRLGASAVFRGGTGPPCVRGSHADPRRNPAAAPQVFAALEACRADGRARGDPRPGPLPDTGARAWAGLLGRARGTPLPRSLANIFRELRDDIGAARMTATCILGAQGVLLLNTALTVPPGQAGGHARFGWRGGWPTTGARRAVDDRPARLPALGRPAQGFARHIRGEGHLVLQSAHPSPLSARRGFFGSRPFSRVNDWLIARGEKPIDWTRP